MTLTLNLKNETKNKEKTLKFFLGILNSKLFNFLYKWKLDEEGKIYPQVKKTNIEWLPIPQYDDSEIISIEVDKIIKTTSKEEQLRATFLRYLESKYKLVSEHLGLHNWHELEFREFIIEFNKVVNKETGVKLSQTSEMDWMEVFEKKKAEAQSVKSDIIKIDREINRLVYALYNLSESEIQIIEAG